jgi:large subunit ribosomal protein L22
MEARATAKHVRVSARKARMVVDLIRGKSAAQAESILALTPRAAAEPVGKVLHSAMANAEKNHDMRTEALYVSEAFVNEGPTMKRIQPRAMGRAFRILKRTSHITIIVKQREEA